MTGLFLKLSNMKCVAARICVNITFVSFLLLFCERRKLVEITYTYIIQKKKVITEFNPPLFVLLPIFFTILYIFMINS
ncbi:unnamed protein product [Acanthoscelides obtectus]|uniref:Uncharacterized protein n=1 Tax=Acanthoscelides obtectus TaxID=200917 RepID=A0A9P0NX33_ACAOB|nr:unnamed protein product [Acanthoscelides obtectus]CAK1637419.1 hypothetical protein AOBTE_LOCUS9963 [Acanthoscelides obtectus]